MKQVLSRIAARPLGLILVATFAAFATYSATYAVRKGFAGGIYNQEGILGLEYKSALVMAQIIGYTLSKWLGVRIVAEATHRNRATLILSMVAISMTSLLLLAVLPPALGVVCMLINGLPIGMIFGLIFGYLEGRKSTEILVTGLTATQIVSSGIVKSTGSYLVTSGLVANAWMPLVVGLLFAPLLLAGVWILHNLPAPDGADLLRKAPRITMDRKQRLRFIRSFLPGLILFLSTYVLLTAYRDYRDNFAADIWSALGISDSAGLLTATEVPVSLLVLILMLFLNSVADNLKAFRLIHFIAVTGILAGLLSTVAYHFHWIGPSAWITATGLGLYVAYVPLNSIFFDRMIAVFRYPGNAGFMVILADFFGYCGSLMVLLAKSFGSFHSSHSDFYFTISLVIPVLAVIGLIGSWIYYSRKQASDMVQADLKHTISESADLKLKPESTLTGIISV